MEPITKQKIKNKIKNNEPLSIGEVKAVLRFLNLNDVDVIPYTELDFDNLDRPKIILLQAESNDTILPYGHFVCLFRSNDDKHIVFFDSCGTPKGEENNPLYVFSRYLNIQSPDSLLKQVKRYTRDNKFDFNPFKLQPKQSNLCASHCIVRMLNKQLDNKEYFKFLVKLRRQFRYKSIDELIIQIMMLYL